ncbi:MAG: lipoprotein LprG [Chloroflexota bacterium]|jgi:hypothetical protein|nr:lipoprotein LprG [Chloroflexota bacterium]
MRRALVLLVAVTLLLGACGSSNVDAARLLRDAGTAMKAIKTVQLDATFGPGAKLGEYTLASASGRVKLPTDSELVGSVKQGDSVFRVSVLTYGSDTYLKASILPYTRLTAEEAMSYPSAAKLLNPDTGLPSVIGDGKNATVDGTESVDGKDSYKVSAEYPPEALAKPLAPFQVTGPIKATLWIGKDDSLVRRVRISGHIFDATTDTFIEVAFHDFNGPVEIQNPG